MGKGTTSADEDGCVDLMTLRRGNTGSGWEELELRDGKMGRIITTSYLRVCGDLLGVGRGKHVKKDQNTLA